MAPPVGKKLYASPPMTLGIFFVIRLSFEALKFGLYLIPTKIGLIITPQLYQKQGEIAI